MAWNAVFLPNGDATLFTPLSGNITYLSVEGRTISTGMITSPWAVAPILGPNPINQTGSELLLFTGETGENAIRRCDGLTCTSTATFCVSVVCNNYFLAGIIDDLAIFGYINGSTYFGFLNITSFNLITFPLPPAFASVPAAVYQLSPYASYFSGLE
jgi:hypothetical protein